MFKSLSMIVGTIVISHHVYVATHRTYRFIRRFLIRLAINTLATKPVETEDARDWDTWVSTAMNNVKDPT